MGSRRVKYMANPIKLYEIKGSDWMKGISIQSDFALGGLFQSGNTDPFRKMGYLSSVPANTEIDNTVITSEVTYLASKNSGAEGYVYAINDSLVDKTKSFYRIQISDGSVVDYSDQIDQNSSSPVTHNGLAMYKGRVIYEQGGSLRSNTTTPTTGNDTNILSSASTGGSDTPIMFSQGPDGVLYYTANQNSSIGKIVLVTGTSGNTNTAFTMTDTSMVPKDLCNDGTYLVFIADNNSAKSDYGNATCRVFFWDTIKTKADIIYDIPDDYLISARYVDGKVLILGASGIWVCNSATPPKLVFPLASAKLPTLANQVTTKDNIMYWVAPGLVNRVWAYGAKIGQPILFNPFVLSATSDLALAFVSSGDYFVGSDENGVFLHDTDGTPVSGNAATVVKPLDQTYKFEYVKVVLKAPLASGEQVTLGIFNGDGGVIMNSTIKGFSTYGAKQTLIFNPNGLAGSFSQFEDLYFSLTIEGDIAVQRVTIYGTPLPDDNTQVI